MNGSYFLGDKNFEVRPILEHKLQDNEVMLKVGACGVCGTDVGIYHGHKGSAEVSLPVILGHELSGIVEAVGPGVTLVQVGDHVAVDPNSYCGQCNFCRIGKKQLCDNLYAVGVNRDGGFAEYCYVPENLCYPLNKEIPLEVGAMAEPLACCIHGIDRAKIRLGDSVCVIGGGAIGLMMVQLAKLAGASTILLSEPVEKRRKVALDLGVDFVIDPVNEVLREKIHEYIGTDGADVVIECVGNTHATQAAFDAAKKGATILLFSVPKPESVHPLNLDDIFHKELTVVGSLINPDTHQRAVDLINSKRINIAPIITHTFPIDEVETAIKMQMSDESLKVVVSPRF